jgi:hypothetical protein
MCVHEVHHQRFTFNLDALYGSKVYDVPMCKCFSDYRVTTKITTRYDTQYTRMVTNYKLRIFVFYYSNGLLIHNSSYLSEAKHHHYKNGCVMN